MGATPQTALFVEGSRFHWFQQFSIDDASSARDVANAIGIVLTEAGSEAYVLFGFSAATCDRLAVARPAELGDFERLESPSGHAAIPDQTQIALWVHGDRHDSNYDVAATAATAFSAVGSLTHDWPSFVYRDERDLTGFIDGTENPEVDEARALAVVGAGDAAGGSVMFLQRWVHDLQSFHELPVDEQERVIGRTKPDSIELAEDELPDNAHISRMVMEDDAGDEIEIYRRSVPWASAREGGLNFLAFTDEQRKIADMLYRMYGLDGGPTDRLLDFSTAVSGAYFFAPSQQALAAVMA